MLSVGIRELRSRISRYVDLAAAGETVEITRSGRTIARLVGEPDEAVVADALARGRLASAGGAFRRPSRRVKLRGRGPGVDALVDEGRR
jgi:prevent-host-death family protein